MRRDDDTNPRKQFPPALVLSFFFDADIVTRWRRACVSFMRQTGSSGSKYLLVFILDAPHAGARVRKLRIQRQIGCKSRWYWSCIHLSLILSLDLVWISLLAPAEDTGQCHEEVGKLMHGTFVPLIRSATAGKAGNPLFCRQVECSSVVAVADSETGQRYYPGFRYLCPFAPVSPFLPSTGLSLLFCDYGRTE